jgi:hypothetical protein
MHTNDPDRQPPADFGTITQTEDGSTRVSWFLEDEQASVEIIQRQDGQLVASLEGWE